MVVGVVNWCGERGRHEYSLPPLSMGNRAGKKDGKMPSVWVVALRWYKRPRCGSQAKRCVPRTGTR